MPNVLDRNFDFLTNGTVTAAGLHNLIDETNIYAGLISTQEAKTTVGTGDLLLIADSSSIGSPQITANRVTVQKLFSDTLTNGTLSGATITNGTIPTLTAGTTTSTAATITTGTIQALTTGTTTSTNEVVTNGTITNLSATTSTFLGTITGSTNVVNIGSGQIYKDASGNVGIGTNSPLVSAGFTSLTLNGTTSGILEIKSNGTQKGAFFNDGSLTRLRSSGTLAFDANNTEAMRIDSSGNVGIGTTSPQTPLHVKSSSNTEILMLQSAHNTGQALITYHKSNGTRKAYIGYGSSVNEQFFIANEENGPISFDTNGTERLRIDSSGNVGIGIASPGAKFGVSDGTVNIQLSPDSANSRGVIGTAGGHSIAFAPNGTTRLTIDQANGTITSQPTYDNTAAGSDVIVTSTGLIRRTSSSLKYKKDIENLDSSIVDNAIDRLRPVWYRTKNPEGDDKATWSHVGLIAEEVDSVEPRLVRYRTVEVSTNENGERIETQLENPIPEDVDYARLSVILLSEVKAQRVKIASLEARLEALEAK